MLIFCALLAIVWLRHHPRVPNEGDQNVVVALDQAKDLFPETTSLAALPDGEPGVAALDAAGEPLGTLLVSGPDTVRITGYGGPIPVVIGLDADHEVMGILLLDNA